MATKSRLSDFDPALAEVIREGESGDDVTVIVRLSKAAELPEGTRVITQFGDIATLRVRRNRLTELAESDAVSDIEASRRLRMTDEIDECKFAEHERRTAAAYDNQTEYSDENDPNDISAKSPYTRRPAGVTASGRGCVVGVLDWGIDIGFPSFQHPDGNTRLEAIWDQRDHQGSNEANRWGYGRILDTDQINRALAQEYPYEALNYDPADSDSLSKKNGEWQGSHGTHVMDIAAGNGRGGGMSGVAPDADLVFVHLSRTAKVLGHNNLGDSASVLEAIDFVFSTAGDRPCVINMSVGAHGGPHDGTTLVEQGIDRAVWLNDGRAVVNSAGNYFAARAHTHGRLQTGGEDVLQFDVPEGDPTTSELEVYYESSDNFIANVVDPDGNLIAEVSLDEESPLSIDNNEVGFIYHRTRKSGGGDRHIDLFLRPYAPGGVWQLRLQGEVVEDGRFFAVVERESGPSPKFINLDTVTSSTTGTICNGKFSITVGAYDPHQPTRPITRFSSGGPTRDGKAKPELVGPGRNIVAGRSTPPDETPGARYTSKSGTSMAAPHVTGTVALIYEASGRPLNISDTRTILFTSSDCDPFSYGTSHTKDMHRFGYGYLNIESAEKTAREWGRSSMANTESLNEHNEDFDAPEPVAGSDAPTDLVEHKSCTEEKPETLSELDYFTPVEVEEPENTMVSAITNGALSNLSFDAEAEVPYQETVGWSVTDAEECYEESIDSELIDDSLSKALSAFLPSKVPGQLFNFALSLRDLPRDNLARSKVQPENIPESTIRNIEHPYAEENEGEKNFAEEV